MDKGKAPKQDPEPAEERKPTMATAAEFYAPNMDPSYDDYDSAYEDFLNWAESMDSEYDAHFLGE